MAPSIRSIHHCRPRAPPCKYLRISSGLALHPLAHGGEIKVASMKSEPCSLTALLPSVPFKVAFSRYCG